MNLQGLPKRKGKTLAQSLLTFVFVILGLIIIGGCTYYGLGWIKDAMPGTAFYVAAAICAVAYIVLLFVASRQPDLEVDDPEAEDMRLPYTGDVAVTGLYFLLPIVIYPGYSDIDTHVTDNWAGLIAAGLLVGIGTRLANGCTSGHGVCGMSRLSLRGFVATIAYIMAGGIGVILFRHLLGVI